jgi:imidazolonepropionase-like amidohydrolase
VRRLVLLLALSIAVAAGAQEPSLIVHHVPDRDRGPGLLHAQALAVHGDRLQAVGSNDEVLKLAGPNTVLLDLEGKSVLPGLIDSHVRSQQGSRCALNAWRRQSWGHRVLVRAGATRAKVLKAWRRQRLSWFTEKRARGAGWR